MNKYDQLWLALTATPGLGARKLKEIYLHTNSIKDLPGILNELDIKPASDISSYLKIIDQFDVAVYTIFSETYPQLLRELPDAPPVIYCLGNTELLTEEAVSIVGTRNYSAYGRHLVNQAVSDQEGVVVSGLALGIDALVHQAALDNSLSTIAVLPGSVVRCYPSSNYKLYKRILSEDGLILSEYLLPTAVQKYQFVARNRIIAGLSCRTIIIEAPERSGALITAYLAHDYFREVLVCPARATDKSFQGNLALLEKNIASVFLPAENALWKGLGTAEQKLINLLLERQAPVGRLARELGYDYGEINKILIDLEAQGFVHRSVTGSYQIK